ncbi:DsbA family protein [Patescibacteria group bacterium]|nr:DsbA family protein [Patescibacteria group bacterium]MBU1703080.1 DsbA family protein [Patescibacteria group bacterium]MBU1953680.1 DsbA family protein [Patescibacteria group bacterium]
MKNKKISKVLFIALMTLGFFIGMGLGYIQGGFMAPRQASDLANELVTGAIIPSSPPVEEIRQPENPASINDLEYMGAISVDDDPALGLPVEQAPVTIIEFSDYQCPFCKDFFDQSFEKLKKEYIDTGKVHYVFRDFPLNVHPQALPAATAANCAAEQGKYWEMHDLLFKGQNEWSFNNNAKKIFEKYAEELEMDMEKYGTCVIDDTQKQRDEVAKDLIDGVKYKVVSSPSFFINGKKVSGAQETDIFRNIIDGEIAAVEAAKKADEEAAP